MPICPVRALRLVMVLGVLAIAGPVFAAAGNGPPAVDTRANMDRLRAVADTLPNNFDGFMQTSRREFQSAEEGVALKYEAPNFIADVFLFHLPDRAPVDIDDESFKEVMAAEDDFLTSTEITEGGRHVSGPWDPIWTMSIGVTPAKLALRQYIEDHARARSSYLAMTTFGGRFAKIRMTIPDYSEDDGFGVAFGFALGIAVRLPE